MEGYYRVTEIGNGRYRIYDPLGVFTDLFVGSERALLWDTSYGFRDLKAVVKTLTDLPLYVVNSHGHIDHACGNYQFDVPIYIHPADLPVLRDHHGPYRKKLAVQMAANAADPLTGQPVNALKSDFDARQYLERPLGNLREVRQGDVFDLGGKQLEVIEVPGHTPGSIGLLYREEKIFYAGDSMNDDLWLFLPEACPLSVYKETLKKAWELDFDTLIMSHTPQPLPKKVLLDYMETAEQLDYSKGYPFSAPLTPEANARRFVREGFTPDDMGSGKPGYAGIVISEEKIC